MKTIKVMSILSLIITALAILVFMTNNDYSSYQNSIGWGYLLGLWGIAYSIVGLVQSNKKNHV